jgi:branched-chain amino acid aminotransferase
MPAYAYYKKEFLPVAEAKMGIMTNALHYGTAIFEGIRGNWNAGRQQIYIFRMKEHYQRLMNGCKVLKMEMPYTVEEMCRLTVEVIRKSQIKEDLYIRPLAYKSTEVLGVRLHNLDADFFVFVIPWGKYIDVDKCRCGVSSWRRTDDNIIPPQVKITGNYANNALAKTEAIDNGFDEAIMLATDGHVSEGSGENIFLIMDGKLVTPPISSNVLAGITRATVIELAQKELGLETIERLVDRAELYLADECFLTGTAAHIQPVTEIDHRKVGNGDIGKVTAELQQIYADVIKGKNPKYMHWCTPAY